ncbi:MAG: hypothetical protein ACKPKO_38925, partial [Candidatus Fonsibacter sp.]
VGQDLPLPMEFVQRCVQSTIVLTHTNSEADVSQFSRSQQEPTARTEMVVGSLPLKNKWNFHLAAASSVQV